MILNLPNRITLLRLLLAIFFFALLARFRIAAPQVWLLDTCTFIFIVAALTDWLDGYLARKRNQVTTLGRILDPFVDKVLVCGAFVLLAGPSFATPDGAQATCVAPWMVVLIFGRELLVTGLRGFSESRGQAFGATFYGKAKMLVQSVTAPVVMYLVAHPDPFALGLPTASIKLVFIWLTVVATALSLVSYLLQSKHILFETPQA